MSAIKYILRNTFLKRMRYPGKSRDILIHITKNKNNFITVNFFKKLFYFFRKYAII